MKQEKDCPACKGSGELRDWKTNIVYAKCSREQIMCEGGNAIDRYGLSCEHEECQACCPHDERDHGICLYCAHDIHD